jgi:hypothetical protein
MHIDSSASVLLFKISPLMSFPRYLPSTRNETNTPPKSLSELGHPYSAVAALECSSEERSQFGRYQHVISTHFPSILVRLTKVCVSSAQTHRILPTYCHAGTDVEAPRPNGDDGEPGQQQQQRGDSVQRLVEGERVVDGRRSAQTVGCENEAAR